MFDKVFLSKELDRINTALKKEIDLLEPAVRPLAEYVLLSGGKRLRPLLTVLCFRALGQTGDEVYPLACAMEFLHSATLMHDDIMDESLLRRGMPTAHTIFGKNSTILSGDVLLAATMLIVLRYKNFQILQRVAEAAIKTAAGEVVEIANLRNSDLAFADYLRIIEGKTAWLTSCACEVGALQAGGSPEQVKAASVYGFELGLAFQMVDDALDLAPESSTGKPSGGDIREGKITPPLYFYLEGLSAEQRDEFLLKFSSGAFDSADITRIVQDMLAGKLDQRTRDLAEEHLHKARAVLESFPPSIYRDLLHELSFYIQIRNH